MFIPILMWAGELFYSSRIASLLATTFFGGVVLEGRMAIFEHEIAEREHDRNYRLCLNPVYEQHLMKEGLVSGIRFIPFEIKPEDVPPNQKYLVRKWLLTEQEEAQFQDMRKRDNLSLGTGDGSEYYELCKKHGVDPNRMAILTWPESSGLTIDIGWLMLVSDSRLSDEKFMENLQRAEAKS